ncbi:Uncharacterised protein [BD1-7 clade bacterium]|uniref:Sulfotransferase family protein n=1 Tax=BD1-7 clade bacterium TaxID=2029982 RepID=A0A5S9P4Z0_9GAMM|nr:Uncharacterised protein [BD1-7 clade bacterium]CAA0098387.1 Uncharacterised protein [BD1-7 clade bacterium]
MTLQVIGAGFGRTGTVSLKLALEHLGEGPCYHMYEAMKRPQHDVIWHNAIRGKNIEWEHIFSGFKAGVDWPVAYFWEDLSRYYPEAKFILSVRDPEQWYQSISRTIFKVLQETPLNSVALVHRTMTRALIKDGVFEGTIEDKSHVIDIYEKHIEKVRTSLSPERLLIFDTRDGWEPLCSFLNRPVPPIPFPCQNGKSDFDTIMQSWEGNTLAYSKQITAAVGEY